MELGFIHDDFSYKLALGDILSEEGVSINVYAVS